jgi:predicted acyltransferase
MSAQRDRTIDALRGFALIGMVIGNFLLGIVWVPGWLKHATDIGFTFVDLGAPAFMFVIGLNYVTSARRRFQEDGSAAAIQHFVIRYLAILGLGSIFGAGQVLLQINEVSINWGVLQAIGAAGLVTLLFIRWGSWQRLLLGLLILAAYQFLLDRFWLENVLASPHGGMLGSVSWAALLILSTVLADLYHRRDRWFYSVLAASTLSIVLALVLSTWFPISKNRVSPSFVLLSLGLSGWFLCLFHLLVERLGWNLNLLVMWGRNPLLLYVLHLLLQGLLTLPFKAVWGAAEPPGLVFIQISLLLVVLSYIARLLDRRKMYFSL